MKQDVMCFYMLYKRSTLQAIYNSPCRNSRSSKTHSKLAQAVPGLLDIHCFAIIPPLFLKPALLVAAAYLHDSFSRATMSQNIGARPSTLQLDPYHRFCTNGTTVLTCRSCAGNPPRYGLFYHSCLYTSKLTRLF